MWVIRCERGITPGEQDEFLQWFAADPRHSREYAQQRRNWSRLALLADWRPEHSPRPNRDLLAPPPKKAKWIAARRFWILPATFAAAAAVAMGIFFTQSRSIISPTPLAPAPIASIEQHTLPDGSTITLNRGAKISVHYTIEERRVRLERGEAHFAVAKMPGRPFVVDAQGVDVRAVGTAFNLRLDSAAVEVLVTEGRVQVDRNTGVQGAREERDPAEQTTGERQGTESLSSVASPVSNTNPWADIAAGQRAIVTLAPGTSPAVFTVTAEQMAELLAWQPSLLDFTDTPLSAVVAEFNRRNAPVNITIADAGLAQMEVSASLRSDNIEGFIRLLEVGFGVKAERLGHLVHLRKAKDSERSRAR